MDGEGLAPVGAAGADGEGLAPDDVAGPDRRWGPIAAGLDGEGLAPVGAAVVVVSEPTRDVIAKAAIVVVSEPMRAPLRRNLMERALRPSLVPLEPDWCRFAGPMLRALRPLVPPSSS